MAYRFITAARLSGFFFYNKHMAEKEIKPNIAIPVGEASFTHLISDDYFAKRFSELMPAIKDTFPVPGLLGAWSLSNSKNKLEFTEYLTPQGIAISKKYIFVSAYDHKKEVNSVIYVIDRKKKKFVKTVVMKDMAHLGGIYFDENNDELWATGNWSKDEDIIIFDLKQIEDYDIQKEKVLKPKYIFKLASISRSSALTIFDKKLYVAVFDRTDFGSVQVFDITRKGKKKYLDNLSAKPRSVFYSDTSFRSIKQTQGIDLNDESMILSASFGTRYSRLVRYRREAGGFYKARMAKLPPYLEQIVYENDTIFGIFEGSALAYRERTSKIVDRILQLDERILFEKSRPYLQLAKTPLEFD